MLWKIGEAVHEPTWRTTASTPPTPPGWTRSCGAADDPRRRSGPAVTGLLFDGLYEYYSPGHPARHHPGRPGRRRRG
ncbi:hypothetical protein HBB16_18975 [Pseudonocardia sp. MCCB 268]|nr:hypothetical protein [Pseudonocardia cytotoxica]